MISITKATTSLFLLIASGREIDAASATRRNIPALKGAAPAASKSEEIYDLGQSHGHNHVTNANMKKIPNGGAPSTTNIVASSISSGYTYKLQLNATLPLELDGTGKPVIDNCVEWMNHDGSSNGANFTWYGLRIQLSDDASTGSGGWASNVVRATIDLGMVQTYNATPPQTLLEFNITTPETQPIVHMNWNDAPFYETFKFDFVDTQGSDASTTADGSTYQEFKKEMRGSVSCYGDPPGSSRRFLTPVIPTLTISMQKFSEEGNTPPPTPPSPPSSAGLAVPHILSLGFPAIAGLGAVMLF